MPQGLSQGNCKYTVLSAGTQTNTATYTVNPGQAGEAAGLQGVSGNLPSTFSVFYGVAIQSSGTNTTTGTGTAVGSQVVNVYDVIPPTGVGTNTATVTNQIAIGTATPGQIVTPAGVTSQMPGLGLRYYGALVVEISGALTLGTANCLWD